MKLHTPFYLFATAHLTAFLGPGFLLLRDYVPVHTLYFFFSGDEVVESIVTGWSENVPVRSLLEPET